MRILLVHNRYQQRGGEDTVVAAEEALLLSGGHEVHLLTVDNDQIEGIAATVRAALQVAYSTPAREHFRAHLEQVRPDVVHVHNLFPRLSPSILDACHDAGVPVIQTLHNFRYICAGGLLLRNRQICKDCLGRSPYQAVRYGCYRGSRLGSLAVARMIDLHRRRGTWSSRVACFISLTAFAREIFVDAGFPADRVIVKPNFTIDPYDASDLNPASKRDGALFVGRLSHEKGIHLLLEAWRGLDRPLTVVGDGPELDLLRASAPPTVRFTGALDRAGVQAEMSRAGLLVVPSIWYETFGMVVVEAMAHGLPAVVSRHGAIAELVEHGRSGLHFTPGDVDDLRRTMKGALASPDTLATMGLRARACFEANYTATENLRQLEAIYNAALLNSGSVSPSPKQMLKPATAIPESPFKEAPCLLQTSGG